MNADPLIGDNAAAGRPGFSAEGRVAAVVLATIVLICAFAPVIAPGPEVQWEITGQHNQPPSVTHPLGTDQSSRDVLSRVLHGGRLSLGVALLATLVSITFGTVYGAAAGYAGGIKGVVLQRVLDALLAIPRVLLLIAMLAAWEKLPIGGFIVVLGATGWYGLARLVRGQVLALKDRDFVVSARALGASHSRILFRHVLPNVLTPIVVAATLGVGQVIVLEAGLSYLGIGVPVPAASWGSMILDGYDQLAASWWISLFPAIAIVLTVLSFNVLGDALLRALQPRQTGP